MTRGRKLGTILVNSHNARLLEMVPGEVRWIETALNRYPHDMRTINTPQTRRPESLRGRKFQTTLYTAVSASRAGDVRYLIRLERLK